jgi:hypothetical protein
MTTSTELKAGDRIHFRRIDGKIASDTIRGLFVQTETLEPYAPNRSYLAATLTNHSWCSLESIIYVASGKRSQAS